MQRFPQIYNLFMAAHPAGGYGWKSIFPKGILWKGGCLIIRAVFYLGQYGTLSSGRSFLDADPILDVSAPKNAVSTIKQNRVLHTQRARPLTLPPWVCVQNLSCEREAVKNTLCKKHTVQKCICGSHFWFWLLQINKCMGNIAMLVRSQKIKIGLWCQRRTNTTLNLYFRHKILHINFNKVTP